MEGLKDHPVVADRIIIMVDPILIYKSNRSTRIDGNRSFCVNVGQTVSWRVNLVTGNIFMCFGVVLKRAPSWREATTLNLLADPAPV